MEERALQRGYVLAGVAFAIVTVLPWVAKAVLMFAVAIWFAVALEIALLIDLIRALI